MKLQKVHTALLTADLAAAKAGIRSYLPDNDSRTKPGRSPDRHVETHRRALHGAVSTG
jgi:hypothetical protein